MWSLRTYFSPARGLAYFLSPEHLIFQVQVMLTFWVAVGRFPSVKVVSRWRMCECWWLWVLNNLAILWRRGEIMFVCLLWVFFWLKSYHHWSMSQTPDMTFIIDWFLLINVDQCMYQFYVLCFNFQPELISDVLVLKRMFYFLAHRNCPNVWNTKRGATFHFMQKQGFILKWKKSNKPTNTWPIQPTAKKE